MRRYLGCLASGVIPNLSPPHFHKNAPGAGVIELWARVGPCGTALMPPCHLQGALCGSRIWEGAGLGLSLAPSRGTSIPNSPSVSSQFLDMEGTSQDPP